MKKEVKCSCLKVALHGLWTRNSSDVKLSDAPVECCHPSTSPGHSAPSIKQAASRFSFGFTQFSVRDEEEGDKEEKEGEGEGEETAKQTKAKHKGTRRYVELPCNPCLMVRFEREDNEETEEERAETSRHVGYWHLLQQLFSLLSASTSSSLSFQLLNKLFLVVNPLNGGITLLLHFLETECTSHQRLFFLTSLLPRMAERALLLPILFDGSSSSHSSQQKERKAVEGEGEVGGEGERGGWIPLLQRQEEGAVTLTQLQISCLLCHAFFGSFPGRSHGENWNGASRWSTYPSFNFSYFFLAGATTNGEERAVRPHQLHKLRMFLNYFERVTTFGTTCVFAVPSSCSASLQSASCSCSSDVQVVKEEERKETRKEAIKQYETAHKQEKEKEKEENEGAQNIERGQEGNEQEKEKTEEMEAQAKRATAQNEEKERERRIKEGMKRLSRGRVSFRRKVLHKREVPRWRKSRNPLSEVRIFDEGRIEDSGFGVLQADFANRFLGGGVLHQGCVQEEIRFSTNPELIAGMLLCEAMQDNEAIVMKGAEQYSEYSGYGHGLKYEGSVYDKTPRDRAGRREIEIVAMDATQFFDPSKQWQDELIHRELNKAFIAFAERPTPSSPFVLRPLSAVATGHWGCGVFRGNKELKSMLQWMAASEAGRPLFYFTFGAKGETAFVEALAEVVRLAEMQGMTVGQLYKWVLKYCQSYSKASQAGSSSTPPSSLFAFLQQALSIIGNSTCFVFLFRCWSKLVDGFIQEVRGMEAKEQSLVEWGEGDGIPLKKNKFSSAKLLILYLSLYSNT
ncbi:poly(ADP-ribose) glycohydrolase [Balamuthia mandrillaris]